VFYCTVQLNAVDFLSLSVCNVDILVYVIVKFARCFICVLCLQKTPLSELIYIADNLAYFPYQQQDEPLFIMHQLDIIVSVSGSNLLQSFKEVSIVLCIYVVVSV